MHWQVSLIASGYKMDRQRVLLVICVIFTVTIWNTEAIVHNQKHKTGTYKYQTAYFNVSVDHFGFSNADTFPMRYLFNTDSFSQGGPILFYCGNEGDIEDFAENTGFMWELAPKFKALVLFAEHRYYGKSFPYGNSSFKDAAHLGYLTSEQALADYAVFLTWFKQNTKGASNSPVIAFGGSYGGMLAAWMRAKYPHIITGSLAASAPVWQYEGVTSCEAYNQIVTKTFGRYGDNCVENIRQSWKAITDVFNSGSSGRDYLKSTFNICGSMNDEKNLTSLKQWLTGAWSNIAMVEYPYPANFLQNLPAWPIKGVCSYLQDKYWVDSKLLVKHVAQAAQAYFNYSGSYPGDCFNTDAEPDNLGADQGWNFQACSEQIMPMCADNKQDMFEASGWDLQSYVKSCADTYKIKPQPFWILTNFLGTNLKGVTNIIFSNGVLDPWHGGGILESIPEQNITAIIIPNGAHHLDLRASNPADPVDVTAARDTEVNIISQWITDAYNRR